MPRFELDVSDMERHAVELRLHVEKAKRRFMKAQMVDKFEAIIRNSLPTIEENEQNSIKIDHVDAEVARQLNSFLDNVISKCNRYEQHEMLQSALRESLQQSRKRSIIDPQTGSQVEPLCFFCGCSKGSDQCHYNVQFSNTMPILPLQQTPLGPPSSRNATTAGLGSGGGGSNSSLPHSPVSPDEDFFPRPHVTLTTYDDDHGDNGNNNWDEPPPAQPQARPHSQSQANIEELQRQRPPPQTQQQHEPAAGVPADAAAAPASMTPPVPTPELELPTSAASTASTVSPPPSATAAPTTNVRTTTTTTTTVGPFALNLSIQPNHQNVAANNTQTTNASQGQLEIDDHEDSLHEWFEEAATKRSNSTPLKRGGGVGAGSTGAPSNGPRLSDVDSDDDDTTDDDDEATDLDEEQQDKKKVKFCETKTITSKRKFTPKNAIKKKPLVESGFQSGQLSTVAAAPPPITTTNNTSTAPAITKTTAAAKTIAPVAKTTVPAVKTTVPAVRTTAAAAKSLSQSPAQSLSQSQSQSQSHTISFSHNSAVSISESVKRGPRTRKTPMRSRASLVVQAKRKTSSQGNSKQFKHI